MSDFEWPWEYSFPPFFTIQPNAETRTQQLKTWINLIVKYHKHNKSSNCYITEDTELFKNDQISRDLSFEDRVIVFNELEQKGLASPLDKKKTQWQVYWYPLEELGELIYKWAVISGMTNTVCTLFELIEGENTRDEEFYGLDSAVMILALKTLERNNKCELILTPDIEGVKFF